jgi:hypothetical protein
MPDKLTLDQFGAKVKEKYPEYKDVNNEELAQKMLDKYPEYSESVELKKKVSTKDSPVSGDQSSPLESAGKENTSKSPSKTGDFTDYAKNLIYNFPEQKPSENTNTYPFGQNPQPPKDEYTSKYQDKLNERLNTRWKGEAPDQMVRSFMSWQTKLTEKYTPLIKQAKTKDEIHKISDEYSKELDEAANKEYMEKTTDEDGNVGYKLKKNIVDDYEKELKSANQYAVQEVGVPENKDKSYLNSLYYKLGIGSKRVMGDLTNALDFVIPYKKLLHLEDDPQYEKMIYDEMGKKAKYYENTASEFIKKGEVGKAIGSLVLDVTEQVPMLSTIAMGGEAGLARQVIGTEALGAGVSKYGELKDLDVSQSAKIYNAMMTSLNFVALGEIGGNQIMQSAKNLSTKFGEEKAKELLTKSLNSKLQNASQIIAEGTSPALKGFGIGATTQLSSNIVDKATIDPNKDINEGVVDAGITWAFMDKAMGLHKDVAKAREAIDLAKGKIPKDIPIEDFAKSLDLILDKDFITEQNKTLDNAFQSNKVNEIDQKLNVVSQPRLVKEKINILNKNISDELAKEYPDVNKISELDGELSTIEQSIKVKMSPEVEVIDKKIEGLRKEREGLYKEDLTGTELQKQAKEENRINTQLSSLLKQKQAIKQKFYDEPLRGIDDVFDKDMHREEKNQAHDELKQTLPDIKNVEQLKSEKNEKQNEGSIGQEGNLQAVRTEEKSGGEKESSPKQENEEVNAKSVRKDEGEVQKGGTEPKVSKDESGQNLQRQEEAGTKTRDEKDEVIPELVPEGMGEPNPSSAKSEIKLGEKEPTAKGIKNRVGAKDKEMFTKPIMKDDNRIGDISYEDKGNNRVIKRFDIDKEHQGKGFGKETIRQLAREAELEGKTLVSDKADMNNENSVRVYESLVKSGEAERLPDNSYKMLPSKEDGINKPTDTTLKREAIKENTTQEEYNKIKEQLPETKDRKLIEQSKSEFDKDQSGFVKKIESKVKDVIKNKVGSAKDLSDMLLNSTRLKNRERELLDEITNTKDKKEVEDKQKELLNLRRDLIDTETAASILGTQSSSIFRTLQQVMKDDYSLSSIRKRYLAARGLTEATPEMEAHINKLHERNLELEKKIQDLETSETDLKAQNELLKQYKEDVKNQRKSDRSIKTTERIGNSNARIAKAKEQLRKLRGQLSSGVNPEAAIQVGIIAKEKVYQGVVKLDELVKNVLDDIKDIFPEWTEKDVRDHLAYVQKSRPISEEAKIGQTLKKTAQVQKKIEEKDYSKKQRVIKEDSPKLRNAKIEYEKFKEQLRLDELRELYKNKPDYQKGLDYAFAVQRAVILSYMSTIGKIGGVVAHNLILKVPELTLQKGLSKLLPNIYGKAEIYGDVSPKAIAKYYTEFGELMTTKFLDHFKSEFKGQDELDLLYGKKRPSVLPWVLEIPGRSHGYIKSFVKHPEFKFAKQQIAEARLKAGIDIYKPEEMLLINQKAYEHANYSILMNNNKVVGMYKDALRSVERNTGAVPKFLIESELPIVKVPTNYIARALTYEFGMFKALTGKPMNQKEYPGLIKLAFKGTKELTTEQAEFLAKNLTKGVFGLSSSVLLGYFLAGHFKTEKEKDKNKPQKGDVNILGANISKTFLHSPIVEGMFAGAYIKNEIDKQIKNGSEVTAMDYVRNSVKAESDLIQKVPFVQQLKYGFVGQMIFNKQANTEVQITRKALGMITPGFVKEIAKYTSGRPEFIKTETAQEEFYSTFPFLRDKLPTEEQRKENKDLKTYLKSHKAKESEKPYYNVLFKLNKAKAKVDKVYKKKGADEMNKYIKNNKLESDISFNHDNGSQIRKLDTVIKYMRDKKDKSQDALLKDNMDKVIKAYKQKTEVELDPVIDDLYRQYVEESDNKRYDKKEALDESK